MTAELKALVEILQEDKKKNDMTMMKQHAKQLLQQAEQTQQPYYEIIAYYFDSFYANFIGQKEDAITSCMKGLECCSQTSNVYYEMMLSNLAGILYSDMGNFLTALHYLLKGYYISKEYPEYSYHHVLLNNIGSLFLSVNLLEEGLQYYLEGYEHLKENRSLQETQEMIVVGNILLTYAQLNQFENLKKWKKQWLQNQKLTLEPTIEYQLSNLYEKMYDHSEYQFEEEIDALLKQLEEEQDLFYRVKSLLDLLELTIYTEYEELADKVYQKAYQFVLELHNPHIEEQLSQLHIRQLKKYHSADVQEEICKNYDILMNAKSFEKETRRMSMMIKINLEQTLYEQRSLLQHNQELLKTNELDDFTGVLNKRAFQKHVIEKLKDHDATQQAAFIMMDIDNFKYINDKYGHPAGDEVIQKIVDILRQEMDDTDLIGRVGGDEFAIYKDPLISSDRLQKRIETILQSTHDIICRGHKQIGMSIGIHIFQKVESFDDLYKKADRALYKAKLNGRNQYALYKNQLKDELYLRAASSINTPRIGISYVMPKLYEILNTNQKSEDVLDQALRYIGTSMNIPYLYLILFYEEEKAAAKVKVFILEGLQISEYLTDGVDPAYRKLFRKEDIYQIQNVEEELLPYENDYQERGVKSTLQKLIRYEDTVYGIIGMSDRVPRLWNSQDVLILDNLACAFATYFESWIKQD